MNSRILTSAYIPEYVRFLRAGGSSEGTVEKYLRDVRAFAAWLGERELEAASGWREHLLERGYAPVTVNSMLSAVNRFLKFLGREDCKIKFLRVQRKAFREQSRELTKNEYQRLLSAAREQGQERLELLMETICATGIRVSEVRYITVEAANCGKAEISLKGKIRTILLPAKLSRKLLKYARRQKIASGEQGVPPQPPAPVRHDLLQGLPGHCEAGGRFGTLLHQHHQDLSDDHRRGTCKAAGKIGSGDVVFVMLTKFPFCPFNPYNICIIIIAQPSQK